MEKELENHLLLFLDLSLLPTLSLCTCAKGSETCRETLQTRPVLLGANHMNMPETKGKFHELMNQLHNPQITFCGSIRVASSIWPHPCKREYFLHLFEKKRKKKPVSPKNSKESQNIISISAALSGVTAKQKNCNKLTGQTWQLGNWWLLGCKLLALQSFHEVSSPLYYDSMQWLGPIEDIN